MSLTPSTPESPPMNAVAVVRGPQAAPVARRTWTIVGAITLALCAGLIAVSFESASLDYARTARLKSHGIPATVTVAQCLGNIGGSGSTPAGYTCWASYRVAGVHYHSVIGAMGTFASPGTPLRVVIDPAQPGTIELASAVAASTPTPRVYLIPTLLALAWSAVCAIAWRRRRRRRRS